MNVVLLGSNTKEEIENNLRIVASAGALSRSEGTVMDVYESKNDYQKNLRLAKAVVGYGHRSISEHDYLVFALEDVTPVIEQTIIEYRLTLFTITSNLAPVSASLSEIDLALSSSTSFWIINPLVAEPSFLI